MRKRTKRIIIFFLLTPFWSAAVLLVTMNSLRNMIYNQLIATQSIVDVGAGIGMRRAGSDVRFHGNLI